MAATQIQDPEEQHIYRSASPGLVASCSEVPVRLHHQSPIHLKTMNKMIQDELNNEIFLICTANSEETTNIINETGKCITIFNKRNNEKCKTDDWDPTSQHCYEKNLQILNSKVINFEA